MVASPAIPIHTIGWYLGVQFGVSKEQEPSHRRARNHDSRRLLVDGRVGVVMYGLRAHGICKAHDAMIRDTPVT